MSEGTVIAGAEGVEGRGGSLHIQTIRQVKHFDRFRGLESRALVCTGSLQGST
ncbi:MAG: hypothetical protein ACRCYY_05940 [Trueperaceae bacterium]